MMWMPKRRESVGKPVFEAELVFCYTVLYSAVQQHWAHPFPHEQNRRAVTKKRTIA